MGKVFVPYLLLLGVFGCLTWLVLDKGQSLPAKPVTIQTAAASVAAPEGPPGLLLLQVIVILVTTRAFGSLARMVKQPVVVGEIIAGICLGPSLLGWLWPAGAQWLFPAKGLPTLLFLSQVGLVFFMFIIGMQLNTANVKHKAGSALMISHVSIVFPFFLGVLLAYYIYDRNAPPRAGFPAFSLFMGISMSVTAFPVLARIVQERKLTGTPLGDLAITCAAADDITAWCLLALVVTISKAGSLSSGLLTMGLSLLFILSMLFVVKPWLARQLEKYGCGDQSRRTVVISFLLVLVSAWIAEAIGIHALFGAFLAGVTMPRNLNLKKMITGKVEDVSMLLLLPIFFAYTGLRTQIGLVGQQQLWGVFAIILLIAVGGKLGGSAVTARCMGYSWQQALSIGALMNTRGLMELVVLNIGYELGILSSGIFALMVLMAIVTTLMTGPLLDRLYRPEHKKVSLLPDPIPRI